MRRVGTVAAGLALAVAMVGCGGKNSSTAGTGSTGAAAEPTCAPSGTTLSVSAKDIKFDKDCLAAPADQAFTISFENKEAIPHSVAILESHSATTALFTGDTFVGPKSTVYKVAALKAGTYHFHCTIHPDQMKGAFIVK